MDDKISYREDFGCWWPLYDHKPEKCFKIVQAFLSDMDFALSLVKDKSVCVQAGGHAGFWPNKLSGHFKTVYTFEPEKMLFECMRRNFGHVQNIIMSDKALGATQDIVHLMAHCSAGSWMVDPFGRHPVEQITIDSLNLPACGAIFLDIELYETEALKGARATIKKFKPILHLEVGASRLESMSEFMKEFDYRLIKDLGRDAVYGPI